MVAKAMEFLLADDSRAAGFDLVEVVRILWSHKWRIIACSLLAMGAALAIAFILPKMFLAKGEVVVRAEAAIAPDADRSFYSAVVNSAVVATEKDVLHADGLLSRVAQNVTFPPALEQPSWFSSHVHAVLLWLGAEEPVTGDRAGELREAARVAYISSVLQTKIDKDSSVIAVQASTHYPEFSADIVNHLLDYYMQDRTAAQSSTARNVGVALQERLRQTSDQIRDTENRVATLLQQPATIEDTEIPGPQRGLALLGADLARAHATLAERQAAYASAASLSASAHGDPARLAGLLDMGGTSTANLRRLYDQKEGDFSRLAKKMKPSLLDGPQAEIDILRRRLTDEAGRIVAQRRADLDAAAQVVRKLTKLYDDASSRISGNSSNVLQLSRERDKLANLQRVGGVILDRLISVAAQPVDPNGRILTRATVPLLPAFPSKTLFAAIGVLTGLILSSSAVLVQGFMRRFRLSAIEQAGLMAGPLLGSIPKFNALTTRNAGLLEQPMTSAIAPADVALLGAAIELENVVTQTGVKVLTVTSALSDEGKSTVAVALGRKLAGFGWRVLLIHCDLHHGATEYLSQHGQRIRAAGAPLPGTVMDQNSPLHVLLFPPVASPIGFLHSRNFHDILDVARHEYDLVLCDTPPVLSVPDGLVVARLSDGVVLVSEFNRTGSVAQVLELSRRVTATGKPVRGVIVTKMRDDDTGYGQRLAYAPSVTGHVEAA